MVFCFIDCAEKIILRLPSADGIRGAPAMTRIPNRRRNRLLRETITEYRRMSEGAQKDADTCKDAAVKARYLAVARSLSELADALQGRPADQSD